MGRYFYAYRSDEGVPCGDKIPVLAESVERAIEIMAAEGRAPAALDSANVPVVNVAVFSPWPWSPKKSSVAPHHLYRGAFVAVGGGWEIIETLRTMFLPAPPSGFTAL